MLQVPADTRAHPVDAEVLSPVPPFAAATVPVRLMLGVVPPELARGADAVTDVTPPLPPGMLIVALTPE